MDDSRIVGKTLMHAARLLGFWRGGYRVVLLGSADDAVGRRVAEDFELGRILRQQPALKRCRVVSAEVYYGLRVLRVRERGE